VAELRGRIGALILDADGLVKLAGGDSRAVSFAKDAYESNAPVVVAASTLTEVLRGGPRDAPVHRVTHRIEITSIDDSIARKAGELLGRVGLSGHTHALDALVAVVAMAQPRPVVLLTSDTKDMEQLTDEPQRPSRERVVVVRV
jgi:predicted nucleic acid-binding protein